MVPLLISNMMDHGISSLTSLEKDGRATNGGMRQDMTRLVKKQSISPRYVFLTCLVYRNKRRSLFSHFVTLQDTRNGVTAFIQSSTAGYFGHVYINNVHNILDGLKHGELPPYFPAEYYVYQGHSDIRGQVELGGKGQYTDGPDGETRDATCNWDNVNNGCKETFEDIDGMEYICGSDCCRVILQEDSGNDLGERCLISSCLEHDYDEKELTYYLVAVSGGSENTRMKAGVGIPKTSNAAAGSHEFSGVFDLSGLIRKEDGHFTLSASDEGFYKRAEEKKVSTNDKYIMINVQASNMNDRIIVEFGADTGGQVMIYKPRLPGH